MVNFQLAFFTEVNEHVNDMSMLNLDFEVGCREKNQGRVT